MSNPSPSTALLVMDMQSVILNFLPKHETTLQNVAKCLKKARKDKIQVIYVRLGFRDGFPEISPKNKSFSSFRKYLSTLSPEEINQIHPSIIPFPGEIVVTKKRISAFSGSDLEMILRSLNIDHLVLTGVATSGVVLCTFLEAMDKDFQLTVVSDACQDKDDTLHQMVVTKLFSGRGEVVSAKEWVE
ncbi:cysteine hydrolase [Echinicola strongylocentroti]|uniref:Cysteine hydrolase n=1 Tax=Echinicola strongylocentroti TaxID=1795355 RepID=A0A2Z4IDZ6_9BACT|nr:isochorismatase family cysteine hydrolase [Echinicola strongylocentroti]AWW28856.1 cysteine hydrolase [Echinicola strongylocentroti]